MLRFKLASIRGTPQRYSDSDMFWAMYLMSGSARVGRKSICKTLGIGEGSVRSILTILTDCRLLDTYQTGSILNARGHDLFDSIPITPAEIDIPDWIPGEQCFAIVVKGVGSKVTDGMRERDAGVRVGGHGCTTIVFRDGRPFVPPDGDLDEFAPEYSEYLMSLDIAGPEDAIIVGSADDEATARTSATNAAFGLLRRAPDNIRTHLSHVLKDIYRTSEEHRPDLCRASLGFL